MPNEVEEELRSKNPELLRLAQERDGAARLLQDLPVRFSPEEISNEGDQQRSWELTGLVYLNARRWREGLPIFQLLYSTTEEREAHSQGYAPLLDQRLFLGTRMPGPC